MQHAPKTNVATNDSKSYHVRPSQLKYY